MVPEYEQEKQENTSAGDQGTEDGLFEKVHLWDSDDEVMNFTITRIRNLEIA